jgi:hypothetical protein
MNFLAGVVFGIVIATIGAHGVANYVDKAVTVIKQEAIKMNK